LLATEPVHAEEAIEQRTDRMGDSRVIRLACVLLCATLLAPGARAQSDGRWPAERPIRMIVPFQAGSSSDTIARIVGQKLAERLGQQIVIDNRVGASSLLGTEAVARALPDGYTLGLANTTTHASAPALTASPPFDPVKDFAPVAMIGSSPFVLLAAPKLTAANVAELIALAKAQPGKLSYASAGPASMSHLAGALFEAMAGVRLIHVPYRGTGQSVVDLMENRIELLFGTIAPSLAHIRNGKMRALATTGERRNAMLPDVATLAEAGLAGYEAALWTALVLPAGAPAAIIERLNREVVAILSTPDTREALDKQGVVVEAGSPAALAARIRADVRKWSDVITTAGIRGQ
jgi:tripartite-type tricarboxylate transporter receptor subunit TctC